MYQRSSNAPLTQGIISASDASRTSLHPNLIPGSHLILNFIHPSNSKHHMPDDKGLLRCPAARFPAAAVVNPKGDIQTTLSPCVSFIRRKCLARGNQHLTEYLVLAILRVTRFKGE